MKFMLDHNLAPGLARALHELCKVDGHSVVALRDKFPENATDEAWVRALGQEGGWAVVSGDRTIFQTEAAKRAWQEVRLPIFFLAKGWSNLTYWPKAAKLIQYWPTILSFSTNVRAGALFVLNVGGKVDVIAPG